MDKSKITPKVLDRYLDASVELFMECYAKTITVEAGSDLLGEPSPQLQHKCEALIKSAHRREKLQSFLKGTGRVLKSAAVIAIAFLALSSFLLLTVDAARKPILNFFIKQNEGAENRENRI